MLPDSRTIRQLAFHYETLNGSVVKMMLCREVAEPLFLLAKQALLDYVCLSLLSHYIAIRD
jgi:hypothetical protein